MGLAVFAICLAAYLSTGRPVPLEEGWDTLPTRVLPFSILRDGTLTLDAFSAQFGRDTREIGYLERRRNRLISHYPIGAAVLAVPFDAPAYAMLRFRGKTSSGDLFAAAERAEGRTASLIGALAVLVLYAILAGWAGAGWAAAIALVFGLGTSMWAVASRQSWQHGPDVFLLLLGLYALSRYEAGALRRAAAGFLLGFMFGVRPAALIFAAAGLVYSVAVKARGRSRFRSGAAFACGAAAAMAPFLIYNLYYFGRLAGGPALAGAKLAPGNIPTGLLGLFLSPNRGLLFFTPIAIVGLAGMAIGIRQARARPLLAAFSAAALVYIVIHAAFPRWMGGWSFGPRYLTEILPILALTSVLAIRRMNRRWLAVSVFLALWSFVVQLGGVTCFGASHWEARMGLPLEEHAWDWKHIELWEDFIVRTGLVHSKILSEPMRAEGFRVQWGRVRLPAVFRAGRPVPVTVRFQNASPLSWLDPNTANLGGHEAVHSVRLGYRWLRADSDSVVSDYSDRADLPAPLDPGGWTTLAIAVTPPGAPGDYRLQFDLVQELVAWFEAKGAARLVIPVHVE